MVQTIIWTYIRFITFGTLFYNQPTESFELCSTPGCVKAANYLLDAMDVTKNPCDNFFDFACGGWIKDNPIPDDKGIFTTFDLARNKVDQQLRTLLENSDVLTSKISNMAKGMFNICMDTDTLNFQKSEPLIAVLQRLGGWPILNSQWTGNNFDVVDLLGKLIGDYGADIFVSFEVGADWRNVTNSMLMVDQGALGLGFGTRDYYLNDTLYGEQMKAYRQLIVDHVEILAADMKIQMTPNMTSDIDEMLLFERKLAQITVPEENRRNSSLMYNKWSVKNLTTVLPFIEWDKLLRIIMPTDVYSFVSKPNFTLNVKEPEFLAKLQTLLKETDKRVLVNYMIWNLINQWSMALDERYEDILQSFAKVMYGRAEKPAIWKTCVSTVSSFLGKAVGAIYVREHFKKEDKAEATAMIENLRKTFTSSVKDLDWMDDGTKLKAIEKANMIIPFIGYPEFILNDTDLDEHYKGLDIKKGDNFFNALKKAIVWNKDDGLKDLLKPFDRNEFIGGPAVVNAYYSPERNAIGFPAGILQPPFFRSDFPKFVNYGAIGAVIGHELTHGFDDQGSQYDKIGNLNDWWSESAFERFRQKTKCFVDQYSNFTVPQVNMKVNGILTQGENIADNGGVKQAFQAYKNYIKDVGKEEQRLPGMQNFTNEQVFFLSFANFWCGSTKPASAIAYLMIDPHSPNMFRTIGSMTNLVEFANAFQCPIGSKMNPDPSKSTRCQIW